MYTNIDKQWKKSNNLPYIGEKNEEIQMIISHEITLKLGREMKIMSHTLSRTILEGMNIGYKK
ncbi:MAG: hypothetical protein MR663_04615 [Lachnospiraceae bacterium]|nr:hypothetical protein [Lachnospiraceae bacterium]